MVDIYDAVRQGKSFQLTIFRRVLQGDTDVEVEGTSCTWGGSAFSRAARRAASIAGRLGASMAAVSAASFCMAVSLCACCSCS